MRPIILREFWCQEQFAGHTQIGCQNICERHPIFDVVEIQEILLSNLHFAC
jgi:hypothetical protein